MSHGDNGNTRGYKRARWLCMCGRSGSFVGSLVVYCLFTDRLSIVVFVPRVVFQLFLSCFSLLPVVNLFRCSRDRLHGYNIVSCIPVPIYR